MEEMQDVLRAQSCPQGEKVMVRIGQRSAAADRDETRVALFRKDHEGGSMRLSPPGLGVEYLAVGHRPAA